MAAGVASVVRSASLTGESNRPPGRGDAASCRTGLLGWATRTPRPDRLGRTLAGGRRGGLPTICLAKVGYRWFEPLRAVWAGAGGDEAWVSE